MSQDQFSGDPRSWLSQVAVKGAEFDSRERQPHPKCLQGTRVDILKYIHGLLDCPEKSQLIWLHGTAGVGKSAIAFTVAENLRALKVAEQTIERRLAGTFFFSRRHRQRCTTGYFFATLAYQLISNFQSLREDMNEMIQENPGLLHPDGSLYDQMEAFFLQPLRGLRYRLKNCPPLVFAVDALDECTSEAEIADLISLLGKTLRDADLPVVHILLTSRSEPHIRNAFQNAEVRPLVREIPVKTSGEGVATIISLDGADVDNDICIFLEHSFRELRSRCPKFLPPTKDELARLASRAGRRFIVASTMMKFIDDEHQDPRDRLELMLKLTSNLLPGTEVYKLYDRVLSTCANPIRAYQHLSIVASLVDPLPMSQISTLLGLGEGRDVETVLVQLRSILDVPSDISLPIQIYHSSVRDYATDPLNCGLPELRHITPPNALLACSSFRLMLQAIPESTALLDALSALKRHSPAVQSRDPRILKRSLSFIVQLLDPLQVLTGLLWVRGDRSLQSWLETLDGRAWLQTQDGDHWLQTRGGQEWLRMKDGLRWLRTHGGREWLQTTGGRHWLQTPRGREWLRWTRGGREWLQNPAVRCWCMPGVQRLLRFPLHIPLQTLGGRDWLQTPGGRDWLQTQRGQERLQTSHGYWLQTLEGREWLQTPGGRYWLQTQEGQEWLQTSHGQAWQSTPAASVWLMMEEFSGTLDEMRGYMVARESYLLPAFQAAQQFGDLPDFLMFPAFLALSLRYQDHSTSTLPQVSFPSNMEVIHDMKAFVEFAKDAQEQSRTASDALNYACQNWALHFSRAPKPWDDMLNHFFKLFWNGHLLSWLERQWCLKGLRSCLVILSEGQKLAQSASAGAINKQTIINKERMDHGVRLWEINRIVSSKVV